MVPTPPFSTGSSNGSSKTHLNSRLCFRPRIPGTIRSCLDDLYKLWKQGIEERRPFQYVVGCEHWRDLILSVEDGVLIPRPETEIIVDLVDDAVKENEELRNGLWADLGTGSGAFAIGVARILGLRCGRVVATDLSRVPLAVASYNVQRCNLQDRVSVKLGSWFDPLKDLLAIHHISLVKILMGYKLKFLNMNQDLLWMGEQMAWMTLSICAMELLQC